MTCFERWSRVLDSQMGGADCACRNALSWLAATDAAFRVRIVVPPDHEAASRMASVLMDLFARYDIRGEVDEGVRGGGATVPLHRDVDVVVVLALSGEMQAFCLANSLAPAARSATSPTPRLLACIPDGASDDYFRRVLRDRHVSVVPLEVGPFLEDRPCRFGLDVVGLCGDDALVKEFEVRRKQGIESLVVILIHGIRTRGAWLDTVRREMERSDLLAVATSYGKLDLPRFLAPFHCTKRGVVKRIQDRVDETRRRWPGKKIVVVAHSFGTYLVGRLIVSGERFHHCIFCGSVLRQDFPFPEGAGRYILNEVGSMDYWPVAASKLNALYGVTGSFGFENGLYVEDRFHADKDHSGFLNAEFARRFWIPYLCDGKVVPGVENPTFSRIQTAVDTVPHIWSLARLAIIVSAVLAVALYGWHRFR